MARTRALSLGVAAALGLSSCGGPAPAVGEGGTSSAGLPTCGHPLPVRGIENGTVRVELDTSGGLDGALELFDCGPSASSPPQAVIAYEVPGSGTQAVLVSTVNPATDPTFDTVLAVRRGACEAPASAVTQWCFDDRGIERRASGAVLAEGGETLYVVVTGYPSEGMVDRGPLRVDITARPNRAPTIESASVLVTPGGVYVDVRGGDEDADAAGVLVTFHGSAHELLDLDGDGDADEDDYLGGAFDRSVAGALAFRESATLASTAPLVGSASEAWVRLFDEAGAVSARDVAAPLRTGEIVGSGAPCGPTRICARELECRDGSCQSSAERAAACAAATPIEIAPPTGGMASTGSGMTVLLPGDGLFSGPCASTVGREALFRVTVPAGRFDVLATTDVPGTAMDVDTVLYARTVCVDPASTPPDGCHDDIDVSTNRRSSLELRDVPSGALTLFVEHYAGVPAGTMARVELQVTLRPVLDVGERCDPTEAMNRCAHGPCPTSTRTCP